MGVSVGYVTEKSDTAERKEAYKQQVVYLTAKEAGFDYLRDFVCFAPDEMVFPEKLNFAIVDEADSILIDEARTPLIISGHGDKSTELYAEADRFAKGLRAFRIKEMDTDKRRAVTKEVKKIIGSVDFRNVGDPQKRRELYNYFWNISNEIA